MAKVADRIQWILRNKRAPDGGDWHAKTLSVASGLASAHIGMILRGKIKNPSTETLSIIARTAGVSSHWLITGRGRPEDADDAADAGAPAFEPSPPVAPRLRNLPNWPELLDAARELEPTLRDKDWVWELAGDSHPLLTQPLTPAILADIARLIAKHVPPPSVPRAPPRS